MTLELVSPLEAGISVRDLETTSHFYREQLGLRYISTLEVSPALGHTSTFSSAGYRIMRLELETGERLKLVEAGRVPTGEARSGEVPDRQGIAFLTFIADPCGPTGEAT